MVIVERGIHHRYIKPMYRSGAMHVAAHAEPLLPHCTCILRWAAQQSCNHELPMSECSQMIMGMVDKRTCMCTIVYAWILRRDTQLMLTEMRLDCSQHHSPAAAGQDYSQQQQAWNGQQQWHHTAGDQQQQHHQYHVRIPHHPALKMCDHAPQNIIIVQSF